MEAQQDKKKQASPRKEQGNTKDRKRKYHAKNGENNNEKQEQHQRPQRNEKREQEKLQRQQKQKQERQKAKQEYDYNPELITEQTDIPAMPKNNEIKKKPQMKDYRQKQLKVRQKINKLKDAKKDIRAEKFKPTRQIVKGEDSSYDEFRTKVDDVQNLRDRIKEVKNTRNSLRDKLAKLIEQAKTNNATIKTLQGSLKGSKESIVDELRRLEHRLVTDDLTKQQERQLNTEIMARKRVINNAESSQNLQLRLAQAEDRRQELNEQIDAIKEEKQPYEIQSKELNAKIEKINDQIGKVRGVMTQQSTQKNKVKESNDKQWEEWKQNKKHRQDELQAKIEQLEKSIDKIWEDYNESKDGYWKQKHYIDFLRWQTRIKEKKVNDRLYEEKRGEYAKKQKEREKEENMQKYIGEIQLCNFLVNYCKNLGPKDPNKGEQETQQKVDVSKKLSEDKQWKKEKGLQVVQPKKSKLDEEPSKKGKKYKKPKEESKEQKFEIPFSVEMQFEKLKVLAPSSLEDVERAIKELKQREELFTRACSEEVSEADQSQIAEIKTKEKKVKSKAKKEEEEDFPGL